MVIFETPVFTEQIQKLMDDAHYAVFQALLCLNPDAGDIIPGTGGLRKIRCSASGRGKRGGARIIYYWMTKDEQIYMLFAFPKNKQIDLTVEQKKLLQSLVEKELAK